MASGGQGFALDPPGPGRSWTWHDLLKKQVLVSKGPLAFDGVQGSSIPLIYIFPNEIN